MIISRHEKPEREGLGGAEEVLNDSKIRVTGSSNGFEVDLSF